MECRRDRRNDSVTDLAVQGDFDAEKLERAINFIMLMLVRGSMLSLATLLLAFFTGHSHWLSNLLFKLILSVPV